MDWLAFVIGFFVAFAWMAIWVSYKGIWLVFRCIFSFRRPDGFSWQYRGQGQIVYRRSGIYCDIDKYGIKHMYILQNGRIVAEIETEDITEDVKRGNELHETITGRELKLKIVKDE